MLLAMMLLAAPTADAVDVSASTPRHMAASFSVRWQPKAPVNGSPVLIRVASAERLKSLSGKWLEHEVFFAGDTRGKLWYGIAGASLETRPGKYVLELRATSVTGKAITLQKRITVGKAKYHSIAASVPKQYTEPNAEQLREISQDKTLKEQVFARLTLEREWAGNFRPPVKAPISDVFGTSRTFNGRVQSVHQGLDYAVAAGTPVGALNSGTVLLAQPLFFEGDCVVLDHGQGLLTLYMHLSKIEVKPGEHVTSGQQIGLSGGSGRATGPHLHVAVRWQGIYLNPATLLSLQLP
jgi:murein DD-endopeptidase MepM/ murein hydrolase activator NlpD